TAPDRLRHSAFPKSRGEFSALSDTYWKQAAHELIGFLCMIVAVLVSAALFTYWPGDESFNVSAPHEGQVRNLVGPVGAYSSDALFQLLGYPAFLLPMAALWLGIKWFRSRAVESQKATLFGYLLLLMFLPALLALISF